MTLFKLVGGAAALALSCGAIPANATVLSFSGSMTGISTGGPDPTCAPLAFRTSIDPSTSVGASSLGSFTYSSNICQGAGPINGIFAIDFANGSISGTQTGTATPTSTAGLFDVLLSYDILAGTGDFLGATGSFTGMGTADTRIPPTQLSLAFTGNIDAPAVPEPASWALMILGFGAIGWGSRRRRRRVLHQIAQGEGAPSF